MFCSPSSREKIGRAIAIFLFSGILYALNKNIKNNKNLRISPKPLKKADTLSHDENLRLGFLLG